VGVFRVPENGGDPEVVVRAEKDNIYHRPTPLARTNDLLIGTGTHDEPSIGVVDLETGGRTTIALNARLVEHDPPGHESIADEGKPLIWRQRHSMRAEGECAHDVDGPILADPGQHRVALSAALGNVGHHPRLGDDELGYARTIVHRDAAKYRHRRFHLTGARIERSRHQHVLPRIDAGRTDTVCASRLIDPAAVQTQMTGTRYGSNRRS
jgi:hypothetical protein